MLVVTLKSTLRSSIAIAYIALAIAGQASFAQSSGGNFILQQWTAGQSFSVNVVSYSGWFCPTNSTPTFQFTWTPSSVVPGITQSSTGVISGTPGASGMFSLPGTVTDISGLSGACSGTAPFTYTWTINPAPQILTTTLPSGVVGLPYSPPWSVTGGTGSLNFSFTGALPPGLSLDSTGRPVGTPTAAGVYSFSIVATDQVGATTSRPFTVTIFPAVTVAPTALPPGTVGVPYSQIITASGGVGGPYTFSFTGTLPPGLTLSSSGVLNGTPTTAGSFPFTVTATDAPGPLSTAGQRSYVLVINPPPVVLSPASLPNGVVAQPYSQTLTASGGSGSYTFTVTSGTLPAGLTLSTSGVLSGTPTTAGSFPFTVTAADAPGPLSTTGQRSYVLVINPPVVVLSPASLPNGVVAQPYSQTLTASGGSGSYTFTVSSGTLPAGLTLSTSGVLSGTPTASGSSSFVITVSDNSGARDSRSYTIVIAAAIVLSPTTLPDGSVGAAYNQTVSASGGIGPYTFAVTTGTLPVGLALSSGGVLSGTPTSVGTSPFTITATDSTNAKGSRPYSITVATPAVITVLPATLPNGTVGIAYNQTVTASGGTGPYTFVVTTGALPAGLTLSASGVLSGAPTAAGSSTFTIGATSGSASGSRAYTVSIAQAIVIAPATLPPATAGIGYNQTITATGGTAPFTFAVTSGALPSGLALSSTGVLSGTPSSAGSASFTVTATDSRNATGSRPYTLSVSPSASNITNVSGIPPPAEPGATVPLVVAVVDNQGRPVSNAQFVTQVTGGTGTLTQITNNPLDGIYRFEFKIGAGDETRRVGICLQNDTSKCANFVVTTTSAVIVQPAKDVIAPQAVTAVTTPAIQISNIRQRLDQVRFQQSAASTQALKVSMDGQALPPLNAFALSPEKGAKTQSGGGAAADDPFPRWGAFLNGDVAIGKQSTVQTPESTQTGFKLTSKGITLGTDYRFDNNSVLGAALGFLTADTDLNENMGTQDAKGYSFSVYGSYVPVENAYIDLILNMGRNTYDSQRRQQSTSESATSSTSGDQWGIALSAGYSFNRGPVTAIPYARIEYIDAKVDGFTENGVPGEALTISEQRIKSTTLSIGGQASYSFSTSWGVLIPYGRVEFQHVTQSSAQNVYAGLAGALVPATIVPTLSQDKSFGNFALGATGIFARNVSGFFNYDQLFGKDNYRQQKYTLGIRYGF